MPILPIDTGRYGTRKMLTIFDEENRLQRLLDVEAALAWAQSEVGNIPRKDAEKVIKRRDRTRIRFLSFFEEDKSPDDPLFYDLVLNMTRLSMEKAEELVFNLIS